MKTVTVKGRGKARTLAKRCIVYFEIKKFGRIYDEAMNTLNNSIYGVINSLKELGIDSSNMKTLDFSVKPMDMEKSGLGIGGLEEYRVSHRVGVEVENTGRSINKVVEVLVKSGHAPKVWIDFVIEGEKEVREQALINAIIDAKEKGELILKTLGNKIANIKEINYIGSSEQNGIEISRQGEYNFNKIFEEIEIEETIELVFEVK